MNKKDIYSIVYTTTDSVESAEKIAGLILANRLAACIQISSIDSHYRWKGELCKEPETLLTIKTKQSVYDDLQALIQSNHPYENPEIIQVPILNGSDLYLSWIDENIG